MKNPILPILSLMALALFSCGGANQNNGNVANNDSITTESLKTSVEEEAANDWKVDTTIVRAIFKRWFPDRDDFGDELYYNASNETDCEGCNSETTVYCYPMKDGRYLVVVRDGFAGPGCAEALSYATWTFNGGVYDTISDILPVPELEQLLNPSKTEEYKAEIEDFKENYYKEAPLYYLNLEFAPPQFMQIELYPYDCQDTYAGMEESRLNSYSGDEIPKYIWDGERFIKQ